MNLALFMVLLVGSNIISVCLAGKKIKRLAIAETERKYEEEKLASAELS